MDSTLVRVVAGSLSTTQRVFSQPNGRTEKCFQKKRVAFDFAFVLASGLYYVTITMKPAKYILVPQGLLNSLGS